MYICTFYNGYKSKVTNPSKIEVFVTVCIYWNIISWLGGVELPKHQGEAVGMDPFIVGERNGLFFLMGGSFLGLEG